MMNARKDIQVQARRLYRACLRDDSLNEPAAHRVSSVLLEKRPRGYLEILKVFTELVRRHVEGSTATISSAVELTDDERARVVEKLNARYGRSLDYRWTVDPRLLAGIIVRMGDEVTDCSVRMRLKSLFSPRSKF